MTRARLLTTSLLATFAWAHAACASTAPAAARPAATAGRAALPPSLAESAPVVARAYGNQGRFDQAIDVVRLAIAHARDRRDVAAEAALQAELGNVFLGRITFGGAQVGPEPVAAFQRARQLARASGSRAALASALDGEGRLLYWRRLRRGEGEWSAIVGLFERALKLREQLGDRRGMAESAFHIGLTEQFRNQMDRARRSFERARVLAREASDPVLLSYPVRHLAYLADVRGDLKTAVAMHKESLRLREAGGHRTGMVHALIAAADVMSRIDAHDPAALAYLERARALAGELRDSGGQRASEGGLGVVLVRRREPARAIPHLDRALALAEAGGDRMSSAEHLAYLAEARAQLGQRDQAIADLGRARVLAEQLDVAELRTEIDRVAREHALTAAPDRSRPDGRARKR
jgi:tetratricopeptide (TPR) repeat protein